MKPWYKRTEFWVAIVTGGIGTLVALGIVGAEDADTYLKIATRIIGAILGAAALSSYTFSRGLAKMGTGN